MVGVPRFIGHLRELRVLTEAVAAGQSLVFVEGEAGIGKTRLIRELLGSGAFTGTAVLAACPALRQPQTLGPLVDAVRRSTQQPAELGLSALAGTLRLLLPEWADALPPAPEPAEDPTAARHRLFRALAELLERLGTGLLVVEDAHWADEATLEFLLFLRADPGQSLSLVITSRPEDLPAESLLRRLSAHHSSGRPITRLPLEPLTEAETTTMVSSMLDERAVSAEFAGFIHARTEGVPLAVEESVRLLADRADVAWRDGQLVRRDVSQIAVPATIRDAVLERVQRLAPASRAVLRALAVLDEPSGEAVLIQVAGLDADSFAAGLAGALGSGLAAEDTRGRMMFRHALASQAVYEAMPGIVRRAMHLRAGQAAEGTGTVPAAQLARHFHEAGELARWAVHGERAADTAIAAGDALASDRLLRQLIADGELDGRDITRLTGKLTFAMSGGDSDWQAVIQALRATLAAGGLARACQAMLRFQLARVLVIVDDNDGARAELEAAVGDLPAGSMEAAWAMHRLAWPRGTSVPAREHLRWLRRARALPVPASPVDQLHLLVDRVTALLMLGEESGWQEAAGIPGQAPSPGGNYLLGAAAVNVGDEAIRWGRYQQAGECLAHALRMARERGYQRLQDVALVAVAHLDWFTGAWDGLAERVSGYAREAGIQPGARSEAALIGSRLHEAAGDHGRARELLLDVLAQTRQQGTAQYLMEPAAALARLNLAASDTDGALRVTEEPIAIVMTKGIWVWAAEPAPVRVEALVRAGREQEAAELIAAMGRGLRGRNAPAAATALLVCRAILAQAREQHDHGAALLARAENAWLAMPRPYDALLARERRGRCLLAAGRRADSLELLERTARDLSLLGAAGDADRLFRGLRAQGVTARRPVTGRPSYGGELSPRELEVVRLVATGKSDKEIAEALVLSPMTVASHLKSARRKLGVSSRTALAMALVAAGLAGDQPSP